MPSLNLDQLLFFSGLGCCVSLALLLVLILAVGVKEGEEERASERCLGG